MEISKRWRIVPQLCLAIVLLAGSALAGPADLPVTPENVQQARQVLEQLDGLNAAANAEFERLKQDCQQRVLISNCVREVEAMASRYRRDSKTLENQAKEMVRVEDQRIKDERRLQKPAAPLQSEVPITKADDPDIESRKAVKEPKAAKPPSSGSAQSQQPPDTGKSGLSASEQARNRAEYERKIEEAQRRQAESAQRQREIDERRARYRAEQAEKARRAKSQAEEKEGRSTR